MYFRIIGTVQNVYGAQNTNEWQTYNNAFIIRYARGISVTVEYYSVDTADNQEATKTRVLP